MKDFRFKFQTVLRFRRSRRDQCLELLVQILADQQALSGLRAKLKQTRIEQLDELRRLGHEGKLDVDRAAARRYYAGQLSGEIHNVESQQDLIKQHLDMCRQTLAQAEREVKALEKLQERQFAHFRYEQEKQTAHELEEAWLASHAGEYSK